MAYAILRHGKIKSSTKGIAAAHNHREGEPAPSTTSAHFQSPKSRRPPNINPELTKLNWSTYKDKTAGGMVKRIASKLPEGRRKDAVEAIELILSASPEFFDSIELDRTKLAKKPAFAKWVQDSVEWARKEFGENLVDVCLHLDETSPHLHIMAVPLTVDGRLCAKEILAPKELIRRQDDYAKAMKAHGLQRGLDAKLTGRQHVKLKDDRRAVTKALKGKIPAIPAKSGILDLGYTGRLEEHIKAQEKIIRNLMSERHRVEKAERELSRAIQMLPEADAQAERIKVLERSLRDAQEGTRRIQEQLSKIAPNPMAVDANYASRRALEQGSAALPKDDQAHKL